MPMLWTLRNQWYYICFCRYRCFSSSCLLLLPGAAAPRGSSSCPRCCPTLLPLAAAPHAALGCCRFSSCWLLLLLPGAAAPRGSRGQQQLLLLLPYLWCSCCSCPCCHWMRLMLDVTAQLYSWISDHSIKSCSCEAGTDICGWHGTIRLLQMIFKKTSFACIEMKETKICRLLNFKNKS